MEVYSKVLIAAATENDLSPKVRFVVRNANASKMLVDDERKLLELYILGFTKIRSEI